MKHFKSYIKKKSNNFTNDAFRFAMEQCAVDVKFVTAHNKQVATQTILNQIQASIDFYEKHISGRGQSK